MSNVEFPAGDGFAVIAFVTTLSDFYQGKAPASPFTHEKFFLPDPIIRPSASHHEAMKGISWLAVEFDDNFHYKFIEDMEEKTTCIDYVFEKWHAQAICDDIKASSKTRLSTGDALAGYLVELTRSVMTEPPRYVQQLVGVCDTEHSH